VTEYNFKELPKEAQERVREVAQAFQAIEEDIDRISPPLVPIFRELGIMIAKSIARHEYSEQRLDAIETKMRPVDADSGAQEGTKSVYEKELIGDDEAPEAELPQEPPQDAQEPPEEPGEPALD
jgi:hypothetical protein